MNPPPRLGSVVLTCLLCAVVAVLWHWRALQMPFLSDDYLMVRYLDRAGGTVRWDRALAEFVQPWFGVRDLYRPLISLSFAVELQLWGPDPLAAHAGNLLLLALAVGCVARTAASLLPGAGALAALTAGLTLALHPATVEVTHWVAARTSAMELAWSMLAWAALAARARRGSGRWPVWLAVLLALLSKEGALMLPAVLLGLDGLLRGRRALADWPLHAGLWLLLAGMLGLRLLLLGQATSAEATVPGELIANVVGHARGLLAPPGTPGWLVLSAGAGAVVLLLADGWRRAVLLAALVPAILLPVSRSPADAAGWSGRLAVGAVPVLALAVAVTAAGGRGGLRRALGVAAAVALLAAWGVGAGVWREHYRRGGELVDRVADDLAQVGAAATGQAPLGLVTVGVGGVPVPLLQPKAWYLLASRPFVAADRPVVGLHGLLLRDRAGPELERDLSPARALLDAGGAIAAWEEGNGLRLQRRPALEPPPELAPLDAIPGGFGGDAPLPPLAVAAAELLLAAPLAAGTPCRLRLRADLPLPEPMMVVPARLADDGRSAWFDLQRALGPVLVDRFGGRWTGVEVVCDGAPVPAGSRLRLVPRPQHLELTAPLAGAAVALPELERRLLDHAGADPLQCVILAPSAAVSVTLRAGEPGLPDAARGELGHLAAVAGPIRCWWFVQSPAGAIGPPRRSALDWFVLVPEPD